MSEYRVHITLNENDFETLIKIGEKRKRKVGTVARNMIERAIEDYEDKQMRYILEEHISNPNLKFISNEQLKKALKDLDN